MSQVRRRLTRVLPPQVLLKKYPPLPGDTSSGAAPSREPRSTLITLNPEQVPVPSVLGRQRVTGIPFVFAARAGGGFVVAWALSKGPCDAIESYDFDGQGATPAGVTVHTRLGTATQTASSLLTSAITGYVERHPGLTYLVGDIAPQTDLRGGVPTLTAILRGRVDIWDQRLNGGAGGYAYTANPALHAAWILTSSEFGRIPTTSVDWSSVSTVATAKDTLVDGVASCYLGVVIAQRKTVRATLQAILSQGSMVDRWSGGLWTLTCERSQAVDLTLDDSYLLQADPNGLPALLKSTTGVESQPTEVRVAFVNAANGWKEDYQTAKAPGVDEGTVPSRVLEESCPWITDATVAARYAEDRIAEFIRRERLTLQCKRKAIRIEPGDMLALSTVPVTDGVQGVTVTRTETTQGDWDAGTKVGVESTAGGNLLLTAPTAPAPTFARASTAYDRDDLTVANSGVTRYSTVGTRAAITIEEGTTNLLTANQASVATDLTGLNSYASGGAATFSRDTTEKKQGSASAKLLSTSGSSQNMAILSSGTRTACTAGTSYTASVWAKATGGTSWRVILWWYDSGGALLSSSAGTSSATSATWTRLLVTAAAPAGAITCYVSLEVAAVPAAGAIWWDAAQIEAKAWPTTWQLPGSARVAEDLTIDADTLPLTAGTVRGRFQVTDVTGGAGGHYGPLVTWGASSTRLLIMRDGTSLKVFEHDGSAEIVPTGGTIAANTVYSFAYTWGPAGRFLYVNGVQVATNARTAALVKPPDGYIGRWGTHYLDGDICDVEILRVQETGQNIATWHARTATTPDLNTAYHYPLAGNLNVGCGGYRLSPDLSLATVRTLSQALVTWEGTNDTYTQVRMDASVDGGTTWVTAAPLITQLARGSDMLAITLKLRQVLTTTKTSSIPVLALLTATAIAQVVGWRVVSAQTDVRGPVQLVLAPRYTPSTAGAKMVSTGGVLVDRTSVTTYPDLPDPTEVAPAVTSLSLDVVEGETAGSTSYQIHASWGLSQSSFVVGYLVQLEVSGVTTTVGSFPATTTEVLIPVNTPGLSHAVWVMPLTRNGTMGTADSESVTPGATSPSLSLSLSSSEKCTAPVQPRGTTSPDFAGIQALVSISKGGSWTNVVKMRVFCGDTEVGQLDPGADSFYLTTLKKWDAYYSLGNTVASFWVDDPLTLITVVGVLSDGREFENTLSMSTPAATGSQMQVSGASSHDLAEFRNGAAIQPAVGSSPTTMRGPWFDGSTWIWEASDAGHATIADGVSSATVSLAGTMPSTDYGIGLAPEGNAVVWVSSVTTTQFQINRSGTTGDLGVRWVAKYTN